MELGIIISHPEFCSKFLNNPPSFSLPYFGALYFDSKYLHAFLLDLPLVVGGLDVRFDSMTCSGQ